MIVSVIINSSFSRFLLVGVLNTIVGSGSMFFLFNIVSCSYWVSSAMSYVIAGILSFFLNKYFTFHDKGKSYFQIFLFCLNQVACYFLAYFVADKAICFFAAGLSEKLSGNIALFCGMCLFTALNFLGQKFVVFARGKNG